MLTSVASQTREVYSHCLRLTTNNSSSDLEDTASATSAVPFSRCVAGILVDVGMFGLGQEVRDAALSRALDMAAMEAGVRRAREVAGARVAAARDRIDSVAAGEAALDAKLERRRAELLRAEKRLHTVQKIK